jgi:hypothetical protein
MESGNTGVVALTNDKITELDRAADELIESKQLGGRPRPKHDLVVKLAPIIRKLVAQGAHWKQVETFFRERDVNVTRKTIKAVMEELDRTASASGRATQVGMSSSNRANTRATSNAPPAGNTGGKRRRRSATPAHPDDGLPLGTQLPPPRSTDGKPSGHLPASSDGHAGGDTGDPPAEPLAGTPRKAAATTGVIPEGTLADKQTSINAGDHDRRPAYVETDDSDDEARDTQPALGRNGALSRSSNTSSFESTKRNFG